MSDTTLLIQNCYSWLSSSDDELLGNLNKALKFRELNYQHSRLYKQHLWDGYTEFFNKKNGRFLTGLLPEVAAALKLWNIPCKVIDQRTKVDFLYDSIKPDFLHPWAPPDKKFDLYDYQVDLVNQTLKHRRGIVTASTGAGKAQPLDSLVYTPNGPVKMRDIRLGQIVSTPNGKTAKVLGIYPQGKKDVFEITFTNGDKVRCCKEHLWVVDEIENNSSKIVNTEFLIQNIKNDDGLYNYKIQNIQPLQFTEKQTAIHPYLMGVLLGKGHFNSGVMLLQYIPDDIIEYIQKLINKNYTLKHFDNNVYCISGRYNSENFYTQHLKNYKLKFRLDCQKFIPKEFKYNSIETRLELIRGLLDVNGYHNKNGETCITIASIKLALDFKEMIESLGMICRLIKRTEKKNNFNYEITISHNENFDLFKINARLNQHQKYRKIFHRNIKSIKLIGEEECQCILIDSPEHLYITDHCIQTHNTEIMISILKAIPENCPTLILANRTSLVQQNYERMEEWGFKNFGRLYDKYVEPNVFTCATVQSLHKMQKLLPKIKCLIVDEIHDMMSKTPKKFYNKLENCCMRVALSATWEKFGGRDKCQRYSVKGYFGPVFKTNSSVSENGVVKTKKLQEKGTLSASHCTFFEVNEPELPYDVYLDAVTNGIANNWHFHNMVTKLATSLTGRTLILVERISHGDALQKLIPGAIWVAGKDDLDTRKEVVEKLSTINAKDVVAICTQGIFNTGINVKINNLINAAGGQAEHVIIQRMGRGLRTAKDKDRLNYYDFIFNINQYLLKHSKKRIRILKEEGHEVQIKEFNL